MKDSLLHSCDNFYILLFEKEDNLDFIMKGIYVSTWAHSTITAGYWSMYWSKKLDQNVTYISPKEPFYVVKKSDEKNWLVIVNEKIGWIIVEKWLNIK
jgi:hypothetical protein